MLERTWFTSDTHFGHARILELCDRPFKDVSHMNEMIIHNWNAVVHPDDKVYHLGDVALGPKDQWEAIFSRLNGHKVLIAGNHDAVSATAKEKDRIKYSHLYGVFESVLQSAQVALPNGRTVNLSHFPYNGDSHDGDRFEEVRLEDNGVPLVHGHTHASSTITFSTIGTPQVHVGCDAWNYSPVSDQQVMDTLRVAEDLSTTPTLV